MTLRLPEVWSQICFPSRQVFCNRSCTHRHAQRHFVFLLNRIQGNSLGFFACGFPKLFRMTGGSRVCLFSSHLSQHHESSGSKLLLASIPLLKSSLQLLTGVFKEASFPLVLSVQFTWCYFLVSTSYVKAHYYVSEGRTHLGNINTYKLIWLHRLEEKIMLFSLFYICKFSI